MKEACHEERSNGFARQQDTIQRWGIVCSARHMYIMSAKGSLQCAIVREAYACSFLAAG